MCILRFFFSCLFCFGSFPHDVFFKSLISFAYFCTQLQLYSCRCTELVVIHTLLKTAWRQRGQVQTRCITVEWHNSTPYCREWMRRNDLVLTGKTASRFSNASKRRRIVHFYQTVTVSWWFLKKIHTLGPVLRKFCALLSFVYQSPWK